MIPLIEDAAGAEGRQERRPRDLDQPSPELVRAQLERALISPRFRRSERLSRFLRFIVEEKLAGRPGGVKEYTIGTQVYDRNASFNPAVDTIVRVEARRLRATIQKYYSAEGRADPVRIEVPIGSYEPIFRIQDAQPAEADSPFGAASVAVLPFEDLGPDGDQGRLCDGIAEEIIHALAQVEGLRVVARTSTFAFKRRHEDVRRIGEALDAGSLVDGTVRKQGNRLRITAQLIDISDGFHLWSQRFDREMNDIFAIQDEVAKAVAGVIRARLSQERRQRR